MEKPAKSKNKILKFLPKAASAVTFQNPPFSPGREKRLDNASKLRAYAGRGFSGPIMIPVEARRKSKNESFDTQEPTSPKVSCMGQIKHKKKIHKSKRASPPKNVIKPVSSSKEVKKQKPKELKKQTSTIRNLFRSTKPGRKSDATADRPPLVPDRAPSLSQMKRFASGRESFASFDWTAQIAPVDSDHRDYYSDEEREESDGEEEAKIPFSAPMMLGGGEVALEPRKEVNLWKRRTMAPPRPLQLNTLVKSN
ncbi:hypothetical protein L1049_026779 [Liquidambar formosana]|uniref:Syringolide-induced protein 14-1-1 n=1 Tax=Liquidambar formosana TaxID=63359 RepID=A0AAP0NHN4_LIQFO